MSRPKIWLHHISKIKLKKTKQSPVYCAGNLKHVKFNKMSTFTVQPGNIIMRQPGFFLLLQKASVLVGTICQTAPCGSQFTSSQLLK